MVEDSESDAELIVRALQGAGYDIAWKRVESEAEFLARLADAPDLILSDYSLPQFDGLRALQLTRAQGLDVPFIIVSGTIGEDTAVAAMREGATDYLMKDRLGRLGGAVKRALAEAATQREQARLRGTQHESEQRLQLALTASGMGVWVWEVRTNRVIWSPECYPIMGLPDFDGTLAGFTRWLHPADHDRVMAAVAAAVASHTLLEIDFRLVPPDGKVRWISNHAQTSYDAAGEPLQMVGTMLDITARKRFEAELRESRDNFRQVVESIQEVFWVLDLAAEKIVYVSPNFLNVWGRTPESLYQHRDAWCECIHPNDQARMLAATQTLQSGGLYDETYRIIRPDGAERWIHDKAFPVRNEQGQVFRIVGVAEDITQRKQLEEQFLRSQRVEAVGTLASGIAHDLNNILAPMLMIAPLLRQSLRDEGDRELVNVVQHGAQRGANIIKQLLTFSRGIEGSRGPVQVRHLLKDMIQVMRETFPRDLTLEERMPADLWVVGADATQIHQVLMNLCVNARDAIHGPGRLALVAENVTLTADDLGGRDWTKPGPYVRISVADTGEGIRPENLNRIFEPFFTTKELGKGTGLGLSTVAGIVRSHGGFVAIQSTVGKGSTFAVHLPALPEEREATPLEPIGQLGGRGETILVVDDEFAIRRSLQVTLEEHNYQVLLASDGQEAASRFLEHWSKVRLVITDIMMPRVSGLELVRLVRQLEPKFPIIAMTGLFDPQHREELATLGVTRVLMKPCESSELLAAVHNELAAKR